MLKGIADRGVAHLLEASISLKDTVKLGCNMETRARGLILYHHFMKCVDGNSYDKSMVAAVALCLSGRINEQVIDINSLICIFYNIVNETTEVLHPEGKAFAELKYSLSNLDYVMQRMLEFNLNHRLAHQYLVPFLALIFERSKNVAEFRKELSNTCMRLLSDFYTTGIVLNYKPDHIAVACIDLSLYIHGLINDLVMIPVWYQGFCTDITIEKVKQIKGDMMKLYEISKFFPSFEHNDKEA